MNILLCDDNKTALAELSAAVNKYMEEHHVNCNIVESETSSAVIESNVAFDLAFLDIQMDEINGIKLAEVLKKRNKNIIIFFVTNYSEFQDDAMDLRAFRFFNKPFDIKRLYSGLDKAMEFLNTMLVDIYLKQGSEHTKISVNDICYVKRENRKTTIATINGNYVVKDSWDEWVKKLTQPYFYIVHNSFIINVHHVTKYDYTEVYVNGDRISVATRKQADFRKYWFNYLKGELY